MHSQTHHHFHSSNTDKFFVKQMTMENDRKTSKTNEFIYSSNTEKVTKLKKRWKKKPNKKHHALRTSMRKPRSCKKASKP